MDESPRLDAAIETLIESQTIFDREDGRAWAQLAWKFVESEQLASAIACFRESVRLDPTIVEAWANLGSLHRRAGAMKESSECFLQALRLQPINLDLVQATASALRLIGARDEASRICEKTLETFSNDPVDPSRDSALASLYLLLGNLYQELDRFDESIEYLERGIQRSPRSAPNVSCLGIAYFRKGDIERAIELFRESSHLDPSYADGHFHLGMAYLLTGDYRRGWEEYEWRLGGRKRPVLSSSIPLWQGRPLAANQTLLLAAEQGFGDTIQFVRFASNIKHRFGCNVIVQVQRPLVPLLSTCKGIDRVLSRDEPLPAVDCYLPLASLPSILRFDPAQSKSTEPYLFADPNRVEKWSELLSWNDATQNQKRVFRVGLSWQGDPKFPADRSRSIPLASFRPLLSLPDISWISLQKGVGLEQLSLLEESDKIANFADQLDSDGQAFLDTAAIMQQLDLVITSDTAVAHLAGALGVPVWILLSFVPDWRWNFSGSASVWYPTAILFRQSHLGDWVGVVDQIQQRL